jgi:hypothetical protein
MLLEKHAQLLHESYSPWKHIMKKNSQRKADYFITKFKTTQAGLLRSYMISFLLSIAAICPF